MFKNNSRKGLALGAISALLSSLFIAAPAVQADESSVVIAPHVGTSYTMLVTEEFVLTTRLGNNVASDRAAQLTYRITKVGTGASAYGFTISNTVSAAVPAAIFDPSATGATTNSAMAKVDTESYVVPVSPGIANNMLIIQPFTDSATVAVSSVSPATTVVIRAFLDASGDNLWSTGEAYEDVTVTFVPWATVAPTLAPSAPKEGDKFITASATLNLASLNVAQLNGVFKFAFADQDADGYVTRVSASATISPATVIAQAGVMSASAAATNGLAALSTMSYRVHYDVAAGTPAVITATSANTMAVSTLRATANVGTGTSVSPVVGANLKKSGTDTADARANSAFSVTAGGTTGSGVTLAFLNTTATSLFITSTATLSTERYLVIEGVTYTQSSALPTVSPLALAAATVIDVTPVGFAAGDAFAFTATQGGNTKTLTVTQRVEDYVHTWLDGVDNAVAAPGSSVTLNYKVEDQFGETATGTDLRIVAHTSGTGFSTSDSVSGAVVSGRASVAVSTLPATKTGSATITVALQKLNTARAWETTDVDTITLLVSASAAVFVGNVTDSVSASISYNIVTSPSWSGVISGTASQAGAEIVLSGAGLILENQDTGDSASGTLTIRSGAAGAFNVRVASLTSGTHTVTLTMGTAVTTSQVVVDVAAPTAGASWVFSGATNVAAGSTATIYGKLVDANGNGVYTDGTPTITVTYTGTGIAVGTMPTETDSDGMFAITVLAGSADAGTATLTATYNESGAATLAADRISAAQSITVGGAAAPASDQKLTVGSFKGFVAIYALNYTGQKLSAKVAGKWLVVNELTRFQRVVRNTGAGYTIKVELHIDGVFVRSETVVTK